LQTILFVFTGAAYSWSWNFQKPNLQEGTYKVEQHMGLIKNGHGTASYLFFLYKLWTYLLFLICMCSTRVAICAALFPHCARTTLSSNLHQHVFEANKLLQFYKCLNSYSMLWVFQQSGNY
jgi:hypothetical protein